MNIKQLYNEYKEYNKQIENQNINITIDNKNIDLNKINNKEDINNNIEPQLDPSIIEKYNLNSQVQI